MGPHIDARKEKTIIARARKMDRLRQFFCHKTRKRCKLFLGAACLSETFFSAHERAHDKLKKWAKRKIFIEKHLCVEKVDLNHFWTKKFTILTTSNKLGKGEYEKGVQSTLAHVSRSIRTLNLESKTGSF